MYRVVSRRTGASLAPLLRQQSANFSALHLEPGKARKGWSLVLLTGAAAVGYWGSSTLYASETDLEEIELQPVESDEKAAELSEERQTGTNEQSPCLEQEQEAGGQVDPENAEEVNKQPGKATSEAPVQNSLEEFEKRREDGRVREFIELEKYFEQRLKNEIERIEGEYRTKLANLQEEMKEEREALHRENAVELANELERLKREMEEESQREMEDLLEKETQRIEMELDNYYSQKVIAYREDLTQNLESCNADAMHRVNILKELNQRVRRMQDRWESRTKKEEESERIHQICAVLFRLLTAVESSEGFSKEFHQLKELIGDDILLSQFLRLVSDEVAARGVPTLQDLHNHFDQIRSVVRTQALIPEGSGIAWRFFAKLLSSVTFPVRGLVSGSDPDAVLARAEYFLEKGDLLQAVIELNNFTGVPGMIVQPWLESAKERLLADGMVSLLRTHIAARVLTDSQ